MPGNIIVIGAGTAGLMAGTLLAEAGHSVILLEARNRVGGRAFTTHVEGFSHPIELGAEFIHGRLPLTFSLLREARASVTEAHGEFLQFSNGTLHSPAFSPVDWDKVMREMSTLEQDVPLHEFLSSRFRGNETLYEELKRYAEGYNAADIHSVSTKSLREEWARDGDAEQFRISAGYQELMLHLLKRFMAAGGELQLSAPVTRINWKQGTVEAIANERVYTGTKAVLAIPANLYPMVQFDPPIQHYIEAVSAIGYGNVIKLHFEFDEPFWATSKQSGPMFIFSSAHIPTWWTQSPSRQPLLTGWIAGGAAAKYTTDGTDVLDVATEDIGKIFRMSAQHVRTKIKASHVINWAEERYSGTGYSFKKVHSDRAKQLLAVPIASTLFFTGEALYEGPHTGTVEAALVSARETSSKIL